MSPHHPARIDNARMSRIFLVVVAVGLVIVAAAVLVIGAFPPNPNPQPVQKVLPNDKFQTR
jgi:hypothetical protein